MGKKVNRRLGFAIVRTEDAETVDKLEAEVEELKGNCYEFLELCESKDRTAVELNKTIRLLEDDYLEKNKHIAAKRREFDALQKKYESLSEAHAVVVAVVDKLEADLVDAEINISKKDGFRHWRDEITARLEKEIIDKRITIAELKTEIEILKTTSEVVADDPKTAMIQLVERSHVNLSFAEDYAKEIQIPKHFRRLLYGAANHCDIFLKIVKGEI